ncbi:MAG: GPP34 family phosphoprotein [Bacteroidales bacterium]|nr:GPP34 family phosphoprotein [Bacteroidales bacterium]
MTKAIKDQLILLCIHPEKGWVRKKSVIGHALLAASLIDLSRQNAFWVEEGRIKVAQTNTTDPVFKELLTQLNAWQGKKFSWLMTKLSMHVNKYYTLQMGCLERQHLISSIPIEWLGIRWGKRYRVNNPDNLKPIISDMERSLVYGRNSMTETRLIIEFLGMLDLLGSFFMSKELKQRATKRWKTMSFHLLGEPNEMIQIIFRELRNTLRVNKFSGKG